LESQLGDGEETQLLLSLILGARDRVALRTERAFQRAGLAHLLVFSGAQVTLLYLVSVALLRWPLRRWWWGNLLAAALAVVPTLFVIVIVSIERSSARAGVAALVASIGIVLERGRGMGHSMLISLLTISLIWPCCFLEPGVQLTYAALFGIWLGATLAKSILDKILAVSILASLATSLVSAIWFEKFSLIGLLLNPLLAPLVGIFSAQVGLAALAAFELNLDSHAYALTLLHYLCGRLREFVQWVSELSWSSYAITPAEEIWIVSGAALILMRALYLVARRVWIERGLMYECE
jgi:competence protein ComEC